MGVQKVLAETEQADDAPADPDEGTDEPDLSPFSMGYDTEQYALDAETTDRALSLLIAFTNLL